MGFDGKSNENYEVFFCVNIKKEWIIIGFYECGLKILFVDYM